MGLEVRSIKVAENLFQKAQKYVASCNKTVETNFTSILQTKPQSLEKINTAKLRLAPKLEKDTVTFSSQTSRWAKNPEEYIPDCNIKNSQVPSHHKIDGVNSSLRDIEDLKKGIIDDGEMLAGYNAIKTDKEFALLTPLEKDCMGYRVVHKSHNEYRNKTFSLIEKAKVGDTIVPDNSCAYAFQKEELISANNYSSTNGILEIIRIPLGGRISRNMEHGGEILMPRGAKYKLISKKQIPGGETEVVLEYILPKSNYPEDIEQIKKIAELNKNSLDKFNNKFANKILEELKNI